MLAGRSSGLHLSGASLRMTPVTLSTLVAGICAKKQARDGEDPCLVGKVQLTRCEKNLIVGGDVAAPHVLVFVLARQRTLAQDRTAGRILSNLDHLPRDLDFRELLGLGGVLQRRQRRLAAGDDLRHLVEVAGADEALVLHGGVAVAELAGEFLRPYARV